MQVQVLRLRVEGQVTRRDVCRHCIQERIEGYKYWQSKTHPTYGVAHEMILKLALKNADGKKCPMYEEKKCKFSLELAVAEEK